MEIILEFIKSDMFNLCILITSLILLILFIIVSVRLKNLNKNYKEFMKKLGNGTNIEDSLKKYVEQVENVKEKTEELGKYCKKLDSEMMACIQKTGMVRYSAFKDTGSDLSFALALLDNHNDGVVLNGIYSREMSNIYAKQVIKGETSNKLSDEEKKAIQLAVGQKIEYRIKE